MYAYVRVYVCMSKETRWIPVYLKLVKLYDSPNLWQDDSGANSAAEHTSLGQPEGRAGTKTTETQTEFRLDDFRRRFSRKTSRPHTAETAKWWPDTKYLLSKLKAKKIKTLFSCTVCWSWVRTNPTGVDCCMNGLTTVQWHSNLSHQILFTQDKINVLLFSPFHRGFFHSTSNKEPLS